MTLDGSVTVQPIVPVLETTKSLQDTNGGVAEPTDVILYTIIITNTGCGAQEDNPGHELTDEIPEWLTYVPGSASATSGTAAYDGAGNRVTWNGRIAAGGQVEVSFQATIDADAPTANGSAITEPFIGIQMPMAATIRTRIRTKSV